MIFLDMIIVHLIYQDNHDYCIHTVEIITVSHRTFEDQLACLSDQNIFASTYKHKI